MKQKHHPVGTKAQKNIDRTAGTEPMGNVNEADTINSSVISPSKLVFPKIKGEFSISPEIADLINEPVYPTEEQLKDPRIQHLLNENIR